VRHRPLIVTLLTAEQQIVAEIKKTRYKEISQRKLQNMCGNAPATASAAAEAGAQQQQDGKAKTPKAPRGRKGLLGASPFPLSYHLLDLEGRGVIYKVAAPATNDFILRLKT
jgi:hypothetical protein